MRELEKGRSEGSVTQGQRGGVSSLRLSFCTALGTLPVSLEGPEVHLGTDMERVRVKASPKVEPISVGWGGHSWTHLGSRDEPLQGSYNAI